MRSTTRTSDKEQTGTDTTKVQFQSRVRKVIVDELEQRHYHRRLTESDLSALVSVIAPASSHQEYELILAELGPHLESTIKVLNMAARPDGYVAPQWCSRCHNHGEVGYVAATKTDARAAKRLASHASFRELCDLGSSLQVRALTRTLRALQRIHSSAGWKQSRLRTMAGDALLNVPWRRDRSDVTLRDRALLCLLAGSWPQVRPGTKPEAVIQAEVECLRKLMRRRTKLRGAEHPP